MNLIGRYRNSGFEAVSDAVSEFFGRRQDLQRPGVAFGPEGDGEPAKQGTDISLVAIDRSEPESFALSQLILRGVTAGLSVICRSDRCSSSAARSRACFESDLQSPALRPRGVQAVALRLTISDEATEPVHRVWRFFTATALKMPAPSFTGRTITSLLSGASW